MKAPGAVACVVVSSQKTCFSRESKVPNVCSASRLNIQEKY